MFNLQGSEIIFILLLALVVLGPEKLPSAIRKFTQTYAEIRKMGMGFQTELKSALDEPMREMKETADLLRDAADPMKVVADAEAGSEPDASAEREVERQLRAQEIHDQRSAREAAEAADGESGNAMESVSDAVADDVGTEEVDEWADPIEPVATEPESDQPASQTSPEPDGASGSQTQPGDEPDAASEVEPDEAAVHDVATEREQAGDAEAVPVVGAHDVSESDDVHGSTSAEARGERGPEAADATEAADAGGAQSFSGAHADHEASA